MGDRLEHRAQQAPGDPAPRLILTVTRSPLRGPAAQWRVLVVLGRVDTARVGGLATAVGVSLPSTSRLVRRLERRGLVTTERDMEDRRATLVRITRQGRNIRDSVIIRRRTMMEAAIAARAPSLPRGLAEGLTAIARAFDAYE